MCRSKIKGTCSYSPPCINLPDLPTPLRLQVPESPFYLYSKSRIMYNFEAYKQALAGLSSLPCYAVKVRDRNGAGRHSLERTDSVPSAGVVGWRRIRMGPQAGCPRCPARPSRQGAGKGKGTDDHGAIADSMHAHICLSSLPCYAVKVRAHWN